MKTKVIVTAGLLIAASGIVTADPFDDEFFTGEDTFDDGFFNEGSEAPDDGLENDNTSEDPFNSDSWFNDDFFNEEPEAPSSPEDGSEDENDTEEQPPAPGDGTEDETQVEERHVTPAPEPDYVGEDYISYPNPRDHYMHDEGIHREGSIKVCHIMLNQNGEVITGDTVDNMSLNVDTDIPYEDAQPVTFDTPVDQTADLVGTSDDLIEGDGYMEAECGEFHDLRLNETYHYGEADITGANDEVEVVGYQEFWSNQYEPLNAVEDYGSSSNSDGNITLSEGYNTRHAEVIVVTQITR